MARDILYITAILFALGIGFFLLRFVSTEIVDSTLNVEQINSSNSTVTAIQTIDEGGERLDYILFALFIGFALTLIITAWFLPTHPIFTFMYILIMVIIVAISPVFSNVWEQTTTMSIFGTMVTTDFPITDHIMKHLPYYTAIIGFIGLVITFAKPLKGVGLKE